ncbi:MAG: UvrD-helicase domain-containing protein [Gemmatimonadaceae bacterium]|nr:UvrD-helicase domain-containing protein [Gemmatimonadaceae bacterium]
MAAPIPSADQRQAIEAPLGPVLVVAGPGAGKTFCLIERIRFLISQRGFDPERICAFTFTNKAAGEIAHRLSGLGERSGLVWSGTIHAFCAKLLRDHGAQVGLRRGFGIADEDYQRAVFSRLGTPSRFQKGLLSRISQARFQGKALGDDDARKLRKYEQYLERRNVVDFDTLVIKAAAAMGHPQVGSLVADRFDYVLVDEFQDLNPVQFDIVHALVKSHGNVFGVGDDEQSIYSWAGADPKVFLTFANTFGVHQRVTLRENRRSPSQVVALGRALMKQNASLFDEPRAVDTSHTSPFDVEVRRFSNDAAEAAWLLEDIQRDRETHALGWGQVAVLYRTNPMGSALEAEFLRADVPCRMAQGRALSDDPVVGYLIAALKVIAQPNDVVREAEFMRVVLPGTLFAEALTRADARDNDVLAQLEQIARERPKGSEDARRIRRGRVELQNLATLARRHHRLELLVHELLSQRVGEYRSVIEDRHDEWTDPAANPEVVALASALSDAIACGRPVAFAPMGGIEYALRNMLRAAQPGLLLDRPHPSGPLLIDRDAVPSLGAALGLFKALQLLATREFTNIFADFTAFDIEATSRVIGDARIIELAAVRVRNGAVVDRFQSLVNPGTPIPPDSTRIHHITDAMVADAPSFADVWPSLRDFIGRDVVVAHNGHGYDFPLLRRHVEGIGEPLSLTPFDSLPLARELHAGSRSLSELAHAFGIDAGASHRALDDTVALAQVFQRLNELKLARARKTALTNLLDHLAIGLALTPDRSSEGVALFDVVRIFAFGKYSSALEAYERERAGDAGSPDTPRLIDLLGGAVLMAKVRADKDADSRYPETMARLRRLLEGIDPAAPLSTQLEGFLETVVLSRWDGSEPDQDRVNLLTLHATKGLEFSRVYLVGVADDDLLPGGSERRSEADVDEARRLLYVGMTRTIDRLVLTWAEQRGDSPRVDRRFLVEMGLA